MLRRLSLALLFCLTVAVVQAADIPGYRISNYKLAITPDFHTHRVAIDTQIEVDNPGRLSEFEFTVRKPFHLLPSQIQEPGRTLEASEDGIRIKFAVPKRKFVLHVRTAADAGAISTSENRPVVDDDSLFLIWSDAFYPIDWAQWAPVETVINLPAGYEAVAPGRLIEKSKTKSGSTRFRFSSRLPQVAFSIFADRRWTRTERTVDGFRIVTLLHPESRRFAEQIFSSSPDVLRYFTDLHGYMPTEEFSFVTIPGMYGRRAFSGFIGYPPKALEKLMSVYGRDAHETSLLWWGYTTRANGPGAWQWSEGLGDYVEFMYLENRKLPLPSIFNDFRKQYLATEPSHEPLFSELRGNTPQKFVHGKYPWVMAALRYSIGDEAFGRGIRDLFSAYRCRTFSLDQFVAVFEKASGHSLTSWRKNWFERRGLPELKLTVSQTPDRSHGVELWNVKGMVEQDGAFTGMALDVEFKTPQGSSVDTIRMNEQLAKFTYTGPGPVEVSLDPGMKLLFRVSNLSTPATEATDNPK